MNKYYIVTGANDGCVRIWNFKENKLHKIFNAHQMPITFLKVIKNNKLNLK